MAQRLQVFVPSVMGNDRVAIVTTAVGALIALGTLSSVADCTALTAQLEGMLRLTTLTLKLMKC